MWPYLPSPENPFIPTYYLITSLACIFAIFWAVKRADKKKLSRNTVVDLAFVIMLGSFIGGRLFHVFFEAPRIYSAHPVEVLKFWNGGFVFYGGFVGAWLSTHVLCRLKKIDFWSYADLLAPVFAFAYGFGRIGCFLAGCCYGKPTTCPWGIRFPSFSQAIPDVPLHPTQLYATFWEWAVMLGLLFYETYLPRKGRVFALWIILHGLGRVWQEQFRDDFRGPQVFNLSVSTVISFALLIAGLLIWRQGRLATKRN